MKKTALVLALAIIASCFCILMSGCCWGSSKLIGVWKGEDGITFTFKRGGRYTVIDKDEYKSQYDYEIIGEDLIELESWSGYDVYKYKN